MAIFPFIFVRKELAHKFTEISENHETIHFKQQIELLIVGFYLWYIIEYFLRLCKFWVKGKQANTVIAYRNISFEREAYSNQNNLSYLKNRKPYSWLKYL